MWEDDRQHWEAETKAGTVGATDVIQRESTVAQRDIAEVMERSQTLNVPGANPVGLAVD